MTKTATIPQISTPEILWEKLPPDFQLPDEPVDNLTQPLLAFALREILELARKITSEMLIATNFGICAKVDGKTVVKAPDWVYIPKVIPTNADRRSYTPHLEGDVPLLVMEFLSETDGGEYSVDPNYPYGKWYFYERILQVPIYIIFQPETGRLEVYRLKEGHYELQPPDERGWYEIAEMDLFLGVWQGKKAERKGYWLRWWDREGNLLPWGIEQIEQERQKAERERQEKELALQKLEELKNQLKSMGIQPQEDQ